MPHCKIQCVPRKRFGSTDCLQGDRYICLLYIVSLSAYPNPFRGTHCSSVVKGKDAVLVFSSMH